MAALLQRERTGDGQHVETTLQATGMWSLATDYSAALMSRKDPPRISREVPTQPAWNSYRCGDGRWVLLVHATPLPRYWPAICRALGRPKWAEDERWNTLPGLVAHSRELTAQVAEIVETRTLAEWGRRFDEEGLIWAPVASLTEGIADAQAREMGWFATIEHPVAGTMEVLDTPFKLYGTDTGVRGPAPSAGEHTFEILAEFGVEGDELDGLATAGVLG